MLPGCWAGMLAPASRLAVRPLSGKIGACLASCADTFSCLPTIPDDRVDMLRAGGGGGGGGSGGGREWASVLPGMDKDATLAMLRRDSVLGRY